MIKIFRGHFLRYGGFWTPQLLRQEKSLRMWFLLGTHLSILFFKPLRVVVLSDDSGREPTTIIVPNRERATGAFFGSSDGMDAISEDSERSEVSPVGVNSEDGFIGPALPEQEDREEEEEEENSDPELFPLDFQSVLEDLPVNLQDMSRHVGEDFLCLFVAESLALVLFRDKVGSPERVATEKDWSRMVPDMLKYFDFDDK